MVLIVQQLVTATNRVTAGTNTQESITIHETGNSDARADARAHANLQSRGNSRKASWHWQVDENQAIQSFRDDQITWHAGVASGNRRSISIEVCVNGSVLAAYRNTIELIQQRYPSKALVQHNYWSGKNCPEILRSGKLLTWERFKSLVISPQPTVPDVTVPDVTVPVVPAQNYPHVPLVVDGLWGNFTTKALQLVLPKRYNNGVDLVVDGDFGVITKKALQRWLTDLGEYNGRIDGVFGPMTEAALQRFLQKKGLYVGRIDGDFGPLSVRALQGYLNDQRKYLL